MSIGAVKRDLVRPSILEQVTILRLDSDWIDQIFNLEKSCFLHPWSRELITAEFKHEVSYVWGILLEGQLLGYSLTHIVADELHLLSLGVDPEYQRLGLGQKLISHNLEMARGLGVRTVYLEVRVGNFAAQALYRGLNFRMCGVRRAYYDDTGEDALVLSRDV